MNAVKSLLLPRFDYLVIGCGSGGIASARRAAQYGARVAIIERGRLGGTCVNVGCVPKKIMWTAASLGESLHMAADHCWTGFDPHAARFDMGAMLDKRKAYIQRLNDIYYKNLANDGVTLIRGTAQFLDSKTLLVTPPLSEGKGEPPENSRTVVVGNGGLQFALGEEKVPDESDAKELDKSFFIRTGENREHGVASKVLIACGGGPTPLDIPGGELAINSDGFFELSRVPARLEEGLLLLDLLLIGSVGDVRIYRHDTPTVTEGERWVTEWQCE